MLASAALTAVVGVQVLSGSASEPLVQVQAPTGRWIYPLTADVELSETGPAGSCRILIREGTVRVTSSSCPNQICIQTGAISRPGQWIACLPHQVFVQVSGTRPEGAADAISF